MKTQLLAVAAFAVSAAVASADPPQRQQQGHLVLKFFHIEHQQPQHQSASMANNGSQFTSGNSAPARNQNQSGNPQKIVKKVVKENNYQTQSNAGGLGSQPNIGSTTGNGRNPGGATSSGGTNPSGQSHEKIVKKVVKEEVKQSKTGGSPTGSSTAGSGTNPNPGSQQHEKIVKKVVKEESNLAKNGSTPTGSSTGPTGTAGTGSTPGSTGSQSQNPHHYLRQALKNLAAADMAVRVDKSASASQDVNSAIKNLQKFSQSAHQHNGSKQHAGTSTVSGQSQKGTSQNQSGQNQNHPGPNQNQSGQSQNHPMLQVAQHLEGTLTLINQGAMDRAEHQIHEARGQIEHFMKN